MTESKKGTDEAPHIRIDLKLDDTIFVSVEYNLEKVIELLKAYSIYGCLPADIDRPVEVTTNCSLEKDEQRNHWYGEVTTSVGDSECILDWYKNTCESENTSGEEIRAHEQRAHQTEPHLRSIIWTVLRATIQPCVTASVGYASGFQEAESLEGLIRNITGNLNQVLAPILKKIRSKEDESIGVINDHLDYGMFSCKVKDKFGGTLTVAYKYTPVLIALHKEMTDLLNSQIPSHIEEQIQQSGLEPVEAEALRQRFYNLIPKATTAYTQNAKRIMWYKLPVILSDTINGLVEETICAASNEVSQMIFENDEGKTVGFIIDTKDIVEDTLRRLRKRARERMGAYSQGGPRRPKNHWKTWEGRKEFAQKVLEIRRPIKPILEENPPASSSLRQANRHIKLKDNDTVWEYIIKLLDYWGYEEEEDVYGLARWVALEWVPRDLIFEAFRQRKPHHRDYTPPDFSPQAYEYYHACYELNIDPRRKFNTLKSWFRKGSQGL